MKQPVENLPQHGWQFFLPRNAPSNRSFPYLSFWTQAHFAHTPGTSPDSGSVSPTLRTVLTCAALCAALLFSRPASAHAPIDRGDPGPRTDRAGGGQSGVDVTLSADSDPLPGGIATLTFAAIPAAPAPDLTITWLIEGGGELLGGASVESLGQVPAKQPVQVVRQVRFPTEGVYKVMAVASYQPASGLQLAAAGVLFFTVKADGTSSVSRHDPNASLRIDTNLPMIVEPQITAAGRDAITDDPCFNVSGTVNRIDRRPNQTSAAYDADIRIPVRNALIEMREEDTFFDDSYGTKLTDSNGNYSFSFCDDDGVFDDELELYVRLRAEIRSGGKTVVEVEDSSWIDEVWEFESGRIDSEGGTYTINFQLNQFQSEVFNIADGIFDSWRFWNQLGGDIDGDSTFEDAAEVHYEPGYGDTGSYYQPFWNEITVADDPSNPDPWDDPTFIHEWGHFADDVYGCDDNPGGQHFINQAVSDPELAWGEGYPDYWPSAVRQFTGDPSAIFYFDNIAPNAPGIQLDVENFAPANATLFNPLYEFAIAAMLWDLADNTDDGSDRGVAHGHAFNQEVFTDDTFAENGDIFDDTCTLPVWLLSWRQLNKPTNAATAAAVTQNIGLANPFGTLLAADLNQGDANQQISNVASLHEELELFANNSNQPDYKWWTQLTLIADRSQSMAGVKFNAVKTVMNEQVADLANAPKGVEFSLYSFDNGATSNTNYLKGKFYPDQITPQINSLTTSAAADPNCQVSGLRAMSQALPGKKGGDAWLFTDGDTLQNPSVETTVQQLTSRGIKGSFALLGGCASAPGGSPNTSGSEKNLLGLAANGSQPGGIVPYLLTAIGSGGQFLFVDQTKLADAADIMRAQLSHSAGAGRWSDYVSDGDTYLYDRLTTQEYKWIDTNTEAGGTLQGTPGSTGFPLNITMPQSFPFYGLGSSASIHVFSDGYMTLGAATNGDANNTAIPNPAAPNNGFYILWDALGWEIIICAAAAEAGNEINSPECGGATQRTYTKQEGDWYAITTDGNRFPGTGRRTYQILLNFATGEIRYQYQSVGSDAQGATIGIENGLGNAAVQVSLNDASGAGDNKGYKFVPAPAQPSRTYTVEVDGLMTGIGFLLTGFSGSFDPLAVKYPDGTTVNCNDTAHVLCLNLGLVQYVQADVQGKTGVWSATVSAGPTGMGTFHFSSMGASAISPQSIGSHSLNLGASTFKLSLGGAADGNLLDGWFLTPAGKSFGAHFKFFDDGAHGDGRAGDGVFGSEGFTPPGAGTGYLRLKGKVGNIDFTRTEPAPFVFQPLEVLSLGDALNFGGASNLRFKITNQDSVAHCYYRSTQAPDGWVYTWNMTNIELLLGFCLNPGASITKTLEVHMSDSDPNILPTGAAGEISVNFYEREAGQISDSASARVTRYRAAADISILNKSNSTYLRPTGVDTTTLTVVVLDDQGSIVADGTTVNLAATLGTVTPNQGGTQSGVLDVIFTAGTTEGDALITASTIGQQLISATTQVHIRNALPDALDLVATPNQLAEGVNSTALVATLRDAWGAPMGNQTVRIGVSGDGDLGTINGSDVLTGTTDASGQVSATFTRSNAFSATVEIRAEQVTVENGQSHIALEDSEVLALAGPAPVPAASGSVYLPIIVK